MSYPKSTKGDGTSGWDPPLDPRKEKLWGEMWGGDVVDGDIESRDNAAMEGVIKAARAVDHWAGEQAADHRVLTDLRAALSAFRDTEDAK